MKLEIGESLAYTWLRHVCKCLIVQTNWKVSPKWSSLNRERARDFMNRCDISFYEMFDSHIFKQNTSFDQVLGQGECDAIGIKKAGDGYEYYGLDVAFHKNGLGYGNYKENAEKVISKCVRTAMCLFNYMGTNTGNILFISPKIQSGGINTLRPAIDKLNQLFIENDFNFNTKIYYGESFKNEIIKPTLKIIDEVNDTSELFLRSAQMLNMFNLVQNIETEDVPEDNPLTNEINSPNNKQSRSSRTKYIFEGNSYTMGQLALEIVKNYVGANSNITYNTLKNTFPQKLDFDGKPIIRRVSELSDAELNGRPKRAYVNADDIISLIDANDICVNSQWTKKDMPSFLETARKLGYNIQKEEQTTFFNENPKE